MKTADLQCSKHRCCREMLVKDVDSLDKERDDLLEEIRELAQENQRLRGENGQLAASVERLRGHIVAYQDTGFSELLDTVLSETISSSLAEIKAQAVEEALAEFGTGLIYPSELADYAQSIRQAQEGTE